MEAQATRGTAGSKTRGISDRFAQNHTSTFGINLSTKFSGDITPQRPEDDELMKDLTEDELKAAFRLKSYFLN